MFYLLDIVETFLETEYSKIETRLELTKSNKPVLLSKLEANSIFL